MLRGTRDTSILTDAARSLGRLTRISGTAFGEHFVEEEVPNFLEMGSSDTESPLGAVLALKELARHNPTSFFPHLSASFLCIFGLLRNTQVY